MKLPYETRAFLFELFRNDGGAFDEQLRLLEMQGYRVQRLRDKEYVEWAARCYERGKAEAGNRKE